VELFRCVMIVSKILRKIKEERSALA